MAVPDPAAPRLLLGVCSGTSADGVDLALCRITGAGAERRVEVLHGGAAPLPATARAALGALEGSGPAAVARAHAALGRAFADAARAFLAASGVAGSSLAACGFHGQTVHHHDGAPERDGTLQLGSAAVLAATLGCPVVADFRWPDLAAGGDGAPVSPFADWVRHRHVASRLGLLNLGGIGNLTLLAGEAPPRASDTGPANGPLDALARAELGRPRDEGGAEALRGRVREDLLRELLADPFFSRPVPRSTGLERFGAPLARRLRRRAPEAPTADLLATLVAFAAHGVAATLTAFGEDWAAPDGPPLHLCGGGVHNRALVRALERRLGAERLRPYAALTPEGGPGADPDLREAVAFAVLADARLLEEPASGPETTGARGPTVLGAIWAAPPQGPSDGSRG